MRRQRDVYRQCEKKVRYRSHSDATEAMKCAMRNRDCKLRVYYCELCDGFHLTKRSYDPEKDRFV